MGRAISAALSYRAFPGLMWKGIKMVGTFRDLGRGGCVNRRTFLR